ncbi:MAG: sulfurtransferase [Armatimonadetes bacterium]|nr:sulfurtransferase [Armatimonadota bacterium]
MKHSENFLKLVEDARTRIQEVSIGGVLKKQPSEGSSIWLIDVREDHEWDKDRIPASTHLCKGIIERDIEERIPDHNAEIFLYCGGGFRSALAADNLQKMGYANVFSMAGGIRAWREAGYPIDSGLADD